MKIEPSPLKTIVLDEKKLFSIPWQKWFNALRNWLHSHNHSSDDGGQIDHTSLSNRGNNTHQQIDTFIGNFSNGYCYLGTGWRIRASGTTLYYEYSTDGGTTWLEHSYISQ